MSQPSSVQHVDNGGRNQADDNANTSSSSSSALLNGANNNNKTTSRRAIATQQAQQVVDHLDMNLDNFNLLGVIANPRNKALHTSMHGRSSSANHHHHHNHSNNSPSRQSHSAHGGASSASTSDYWTDINLAMESTLSSVTEQVEAWNAVLEDWSRTILDEDASTAPHVSQLTELPAELQQVSEHLSSLHEYLQQPLARKYAARQYRIRQDECSDENSASGSSNGNNSNNLLDATGQVRLDSGIHAAFFDENFDLSHPSTFESILLISHNIGDDDNDQSNIGTADTRDANLQTLLPLVPPDSLNPGLDKVELALLSQVRQRSDDFFEESVRFSQLQEWIQQLLQQVQTLASNTLRHDWYEPMHLIPLQDKHRSHLYALLVLVDAIQDLLDCQAGISGLLNAQEDLTAIAQIQYGRHLLQGDSAATTTNTTTSKLLLKQLSSLQGVAQQLQQYEQLVVTNLREELVELFLEWDTASLSSRYSSMTTTTTMSGSACNNPVQQRVLDIVQALHQCDALEATRLAYNDRLSETLRLTVRTIVGEFTTAFIATTSNSDTVTGTSLSNIVQDQFMDCLDMILDQVLALLNSATSVDEFCKRECIRFVDDNDSITINSGDGGKIVKEDVIIVEGNEEEGDDNNDADVDTTSETVSVESGPLYSIIAGVVELTSKQIADLLRMRKEAHSLISLDEMKKLWDKNHDFMSQLEKLSHVKATALRTTLTAQAKAFVERRHESNMSSLVAALDSERWTQCEVSLERQDVLTRLCSGRSLTVRDKNISNSTETKQADAIVEGRRYKTVWSCLLLVEMITNNMAAASYFNNLSTTLVSKVCELLRLFNSRTTQLVLGAGAIHSAARLKSINAKHLSLVTQCLDMVIAVLPHVRAAFMAYMPTRQHTLLVSIDQIRKDYGEHKEKVLNKFVFIIGYQVENALAPKIAEIDFDARAKQQNNAGTDEAIQCCVFLEGVATTTSKLHKVLDTLLPPDHLRDVFSRIFAFVDQKVPTLLITASETAAAKPKSSNGNGNASNGSKQFVLPKSDDGKKRLLLEVEEMTRKLNSLSGVQAWEFSVVHVLEKKLEYKLYSDSSCASGDDSGAETDPTNDTTLTNDPEDDDGSNAEDEDVKVVNGSDNAASDENVAHEEQDAVSESNDNNGDTTGGDQDKADDTANTASSSQYLDNHPSEITTL